MGATTMKGEKIVALALCVALLSTIGIVCITYLLQTKNLEEPIVITTGNSELLTENLFFFTIGILLASLFCILLILYFPKKENVQLS